MMFCRLDFTPTGAQCQVQAPEDVRARVVEFANALPGWLQSVPYADGLTFTCRTSKVETDGSVHLIVNCPFTRIAEILTPIRLPRLCPVYGRFFIAKMPQTKTCCRRCEILLRHITQRLRYRPFTCVSEKFRKTYLYLLIHLLIVRGVLPPQAFGAEKAADLPTPTCKGEGVNLPEVLRLSERLLKFISEATEACQQKASRQKESQRKEANKGEREVNEA